MKVLHAAAVMRPGMGMIHQMEWEQLEASNMGIDWQSVMFCPKGSTAPSVITEHWEDCSRQQHRSTVKDWINFRRDFYSWVLAQEMLYDVILIRYYVHDPFLVSYLYRSKKPVYLVHHALEGPELSMGKGAWGAIRCFLDCLVAPFAIRKSKGIIGVTQEIVDYEKERASSKKKSTVYPNGILYDAPLKVLRKSPSVAKNMQLLFVASRFSKWHGLDLLLDAVKQSKRHFILHVVGGDENEIRSLGFKDQRVIFHGRLSEDDIAKLASDCVLGLSSFGLHRNKMKQGCTLKVRRYLMLGLPVYLGYEEVIPDNFPYVMSGFCDMERILRFARDNLDADKKMISDMARPYIEKGQILDKLYKWLEEHFHEYH